MRMRLETSDDYLHPIDADPNHNESRYYNFFDKTVGLGGWVRLGARPNEGYAEMTVCLYLPDGRVGFMFGRPRIDGPLKHDAGGLRFEVVEPFQEHRVSYEGQVCILSAAREMTDPKSAFANNPHVPCSIDLRVTAVGRVWGGEPEREDGDPSPTDPAEGFAHGHTEQHMAITGVVQVDAERFDLTAGLGLRDHSWGPRVWQSIWWYRWIHASFGRLGMAFTVRGERDVNGSQVKGFVYDIDRYGDDHWVPIRDAQLSTEYDDELFPVRNTIQVTTDDNVYVLQGEIWSDIPLRNRRGGQVTRLTEGITRWTCGDLQGAGMSEYLDQIIDDVAVGIAAGA
jgi:hypothetical protein